MIPTLEAGDRCWASRRVSNITLGCAGRMEMGEVFLVCDVCGLLAHSALHSVHKSGENPQVEAQPADNREERKRHLSECASFGGFKCSCSDWSDS